MRVRGETGARVQELEARQDRLEDQNVATQVAAVVAGGHGFHRSDLAVPDAADRAAGEPADDGADAEPVAAGFPRLTAGRGTALAHDDGADAIAMRRKRNQSRDAQQMLPAGAGSAATCDPRVEGRRMSATPAGERA